MISKGVLFELLLTGFFALACLRAQVSHADGRTVRFSELFRFRGRIERLRRSRMQWISILVLLILARLQWSLSFFVEVICALMFVAFVALPTAKSTHAMASRR